MATRGNVIHLYSTVDDQMYAAMWAADPEPAAVQGPLTSADIVELVKTAQVVDDPRARELFGDRVQRGQMLFLATL